MKKVFHFLIPAPLITLMLVVIWLVMTQSYSLGNCVLALGLGLGIPHFSEKLRPQYVRIRKPWVILRLCFIVMVDAWKSNWMVIRILLSPKLTKEDTSIFIRIPLDVRDPNALAVLAMIVTITPGNAWAELSMDRSTLLLHVFDGRIDQQVVIDTVKQRYERPLMEIFE
ncbi:monovalent cation/H+ antiporter subunit E [Lampropedia cohaerens]|uniref:Monovalent cation/H+ antiporter subunit E n=1 Tax=Lampropedia cohaerens TaxID=1610491 RepID=A0A0U1Q077_9BURK|nr:Na+/H+ antiporter subunit E [Lampropedia cohaerens]KKW68157.1 monovalent cation/H+ antiporter subunit E [Lampropedia cohaerens]